MGWPIYIHHVFVSLRLSQGTALSISEVSTYAHVFSTCRWCCSLLWIHKYIQRFFCAVRERLRNPSPLDFLVRKIHSKKNVLLICMSAESVFLLEGLQFACRVQDKIFMYLKLFKQCPVLKLIARRRTPYVSQWKAAGW